MFSFARSVQHLVLIVTLSLLTIASPAFAQTDQRCFAETGLCISGRIRQFWEQNGGLPIFGLPITPQQATMIEGRSLQAQLFERNRLELHPEAVAPYDVQLGRLGADVLTLQGRDFFTFPTSEPQTGCRYFAETRHNVCASFLAAWRQSGLEIDGKPGVSEAESLALFGLPLSEAQQEVIAGQTYTVQWFERARFELHPENQPPFNVLLGLLGQESAKPGPTPAVTTAEGWSPTASTSEPHAQHTATLLPDGRVLVVGGRYVRKGINSTAAVEIYDSVADRWTSAARMLTPRGHHTATLLPDGRILVTGGVIEFAGFYSSLAVAEVYNPAANSWTAVAPMHIERWGHSASLLPNGHVLVAGGVRCSKGEGCRPLDTTEIFDPATNTWFEAAPMPQARADHAAITLRDGRIMLVGGFECFGNDATPACGERITEIYDPAAQRWQTGPAPKARDTDFNGSAAGLLPDGKVLLILGRMPSRTSFEVISLRYDPATSSWGEQASVPGMAFDPALAIRSDGQVLLAGGSGGSWGKPTVISNAARYDPSSNSWSPALSMGASRYMASATVLQDGQVLLVGGFTTYAQSDPSAPATSAERYRFGGP